MYRTNKILSIKENSQFVKASFRRNDRRVKGRFFTKRQARRVNQYLHKISKDITQKAKVATARQMLEIIWHMLNNMEEYRTQNHSLTERKYKRMKDRS